MSEDYANRLVAVINAKDAKIAKLTRELADLKEVLRMMDADGIRAKTLTDQRVDHIVAPLCELHGYGAVMDAAARLWFLKDPNGAFVTGPCAGTIRALLAKSGEGKP